MLLSIIDDNFIKKIKNCYNLLNCFGLCKLLEFNTKIMVIFIQQYNIQILSSFIKRNGPGLRFFKSNR